MLSKHFILCHLLSLLPSIFPSIRVFSYELALHIRWLKYWSFSFSISPSNEYSGLISFKINWFDLLAVQGTPKSFLQHYNSWPCLFLFIIQKKKKVNSLSHVWLFATPWTAACQASLSFTDSQNLFKFMSIESVMPSNLLILCHLLLLPTVFPSIRVFSSESALHIRWPEYGSFSFSISPSNEYSELISFRTDWFDLLAVQGTPKNLI